ncbi:DEAD/DEAH box helicase, partial [Lachnospiraceae bacterium OttesenSCG-928-E19]|nr:DEAD/DEAH box helicase [Lachnospiraceae bacterium OttesenSCG-928-E19]
MKENFSDYGLTEDILDALKLLNYKEPTQIQREVIPYMIAGKNVVAKAQTGSGKTAAFAIPICDKVKWEENAPQALILEPTRELSAQVQDDFFYIGRKKRLKVAALFGGFPIDKQIQTLKQKTHIVTGTPGRVMDHIRRESLKLCQITHLVIDEADLMLDMGFIDEMKEILALLPSECRISLFSATMGEEIKRLVDGRIENAVFITQEEEKETENKIVQKLYAVNEEQKFRDFVNVLIEENPEKCMIFCDTREMVNVLFQKMRRSRIFCGMLHGEMEQRERLKTMNAFRRGGFRFLIATDVAARGIDLEGITHVMNYDFPTGKETYVHRIGRTGRNGASGVAISLVCEDDFRMLDMVRHFTKWELPVEACPQRDIGKEKIFWNTQRQKAVENPTKGQALNQGILRLSIGGGKKSKMRAGDIVGTICSIEDIRVEDIGIIDIRDSKSYVEILNHKGSRVLE